MSELVLTVLEQAKLCFGQWMSSEACWRDHNNCNIPSAQINVHSLRRILFRLLVIFPPQFGITGLDPVQSRFCPLCVLAVKNWYVFTLCIFIVEHIHCFYSSHKCLSLKTVVSLSCSYHVYVSCWENDCVYDPIRLPYIFPGDTEWTVIKNWLRLAECSEGECKDDVSVGI